MLKLRVSLLTWVSVTLKNISLRLEMLSIKYETAATNLLIKNKEKLMAKMTANLEKMPTVRVKVDVKAVESYFNEETKRKF